MFEKARRCIQTVVVVAPALLSGLLATPGRADFYLSGTDQLTVNTWYEGGVLFDQSRADIVPGGEVLLLDAYDTSTVNVAGGSVTELGAHGASTVTAPDGGVWSVTAFDTSTVHISGVCPQYVISRGSSIVNISNVNDGWRAWAYENSTLNLLDVFIDASIEAYGTSTVNFSGSFGGGDWFVADDASTVNIFGGQVRGPFRVLADSTLNFLRIDPSFLLLDSTLRLDGDRVMGIGYMSGRWMDGTAWDAHIDTNEGVIRVVPVPAPGAVLLGVLGLGYSGWRLRRKSRYE